MAKVDVDYDRGYTSSMISTIRKDDGLRRLLSVLLLIVFGCNCSVIGAESDAENGWGDNLEKKALQVNEGDLVLLASRPEEKVHHHHNRIILHARSLSDGWITLHQCHRQIDVVPEAQIVYHEGRIRGLSIGYHRNIGLVWVEGYTVQLRDVQHDAELCITADSKALISKSDGVYVLKNGPFMRRFLDGYYPMHVTMDITLPADCLRVAHISPSPQSGFEVRQLANRLTIDAWFEGRLLTTITFSSNHDDDSKENCIL